MLDWACLLNLLCPWLILFLQLWWRTFGIDRRRSGSGDPDPDAAPPSPRRLLRRRPPRSGMGLGPLRRTGLYVGTQLVILCR